MRVSWQAVVGIALLVMAQLLVAPTWDRRPAPAVADDLAEVVALDDMLVELKPGEFAGTLLLGGLRGLVTDLLWMRAIGAQESGRYYESVALFQLIGRVQPRFEQVWEHMAHDMAYNIAHAMDTTDDKWSWYLAGLDAQSYGCQRNPRSDKLRRYFAWMMFHKGENFLERTERHDWRDLVNPILDRHGLGLQGWDISLTGDQVLLPRAADVHGDRRYLCIADGRAAGWIQAAGSETDLSWQVTPFSGEDLASLQAADSLEMIESLTTFGLADRLYQSSWMTANDDRKRRINYVVRIRAVAIGRDGDRLRNLGFHRRAAQRYIDSLEAWDAALNWSLDDQTDLRDNVRMLALESFANNAGRMLRRAQWLVQALAKNEQAHAAMKAVMRERNWGLCREFLRQSEFRDRIADHKRIRWYDEELLHAPSSP